MENYVFKKIKSIEFGILSPKIIKDMSAAKVVTAELYDREGYPADGGLMDVRLGVIDPGLRCKTCGSKLKECIGHFGYIELARPVIHYHFVKEVLSLLQGTCKECGHVLLDPRQIGKELKKVQQIEKDQGFFEMKKYTNELSKKIRSKSKCPHCSAKLEKIKIEKPTSFYEGENRLSPIEIRARLERIPDDELFLFGLNAEKVRPEWLVLTVLPIPPVTMRPSITLESGERSEDDLTHKLGDIVRINQRLFENIHAGAPEIIIEDLWDLLQYHVTTYFDNNVAQLPPARHRTGQPLKTLHERIKSKEGRIRHNLAGKRTNFSARTIISPDPRLDLNEVGVPMVIALKISVPERVTEWNIDYLKTFITNGPKKYPGSNYIIRPDGARKKITDETKEALLEELEPGYVVERHMMDGDITIFNRQPSLHRMSFMCHKARVLPYKTFRLNPAVCHPYNADFDGDEMNLHVPQTEEARAEAEILMQVQTQLISPGYGLSVIGCIQDAISGNFLLTRELTFDRQKAMNILYAAKVTNLSKLPNKKIVTGKEMFSCILPNDFNFIGKTKQGENVVIKNGQLIEGVMDSTNLGSGKGIMLRRIHKIYGDDIAVDILGQITRLGIKTLLNYGLTTGISDSDLDPEARKKIDNLLNDAYADIDKLIETFNKGDLETLPGKSAEETLELRILERLNISRNVVGDVIGEFAQTSTGTSIMATSGARGNVLNLAMMAGIVGQQALRGKRIQTGFKDRALSCFKRNDLSPKAHGFIKNSFKSGMKPHEFFFMAMTSRDSLMDTALRTPKSGYLYRRLANALQDLKVEYDFTVRDASQQIIEFSYGEDNLDVSKTEKGKLNIKKIIEENL